MPRSGRREDRRYSGEGLRRPRRSSLSWMDRSKISEGMLTPLHRLFLEAKWFTSYVIAKGITNLKPHVDYK